MGSASRESLAALRANLGSAADQGVGTSLLAAAGELVQAPSLVAALVDASASADAKSALVARVFAKLPAGSQSILSAASALSWSSTDEFVAGIEELGIRAAAQSSNEIVDELLAIAGLIDSDHELELNLGSKLAPAADKVALLRRLVAGKVSDTATAVATHLAAFPRGRRLGAALREAARTSADQAGFELATVTVAGALSSAQQSRLASILEATAGRPVKVTTVTDASILGGIRIQMADDIIDGSVQARLDDLRQRLAA